MLHFGVLEMHMISMFEFQSLKQNKIGGATSWSRLHLHGYLASPQRQSTRSSGIHVASAHN